jgi:NADP-dependent 3-hydroxy acid dehydrogenase YdfG
MNSSEDIAEEIVWVASRPDHVQIAQVCECWWFGWAGRY